MENPSTWSPLVETIMSFDPEEEMLKRLIAKGFLPAEPYFEMLGVMRQAYVEYHDNFSRGIPGHSLGRKMEIKLQELLGDDLDYYIP